MMRVLALMLMASAAQAQDVPSGQPLTLHEVLIDEVNAQNWLRFRFVAPQIARDAGLVTYAAAGPDMEHLCQTFAVQYMADFALEAEMVIISLSDRITEFGATNPDATQFFEAFRVENETCIWEAF